MGNIDEPGGQLSAIEQIDAQLQRLAANPLLGRTPPGPFSRPVFTFRIRVGDVTRYLRVSYRYSHDETAVEITAFGPQLF